ncbi:hypothetical protein ACTG2N_22645 [Aeromonas hydrophila]|uniref:hypothetical protein n=1 Tax=Aeromonas hydrophila TaxID=644 RepID=UPI003F79C38B
MTGKGHSLWLAALALLSLQAKAVEVTVAYQTSAEPAKVHPGRRHLCPHQRRHGEVAQV